MKTSFLTLLAVFCLAVGQSTAQNAFGLNTIVCGWTMLMMLGVMNVELAEVLAYEYPEKKRMIAETLKKGGTMET